MKDEEDKDPRCCYNDENVEYRHRDNVVSARCKVCGYETMPYRNEDHARTVLRASAKR